MWFYPMEVYIMSECAGSCATLSQCSIISQSKPLEDLKNKYDERQIAQREMRKNELLEKGDNQNLSTSEAMELAGYRIQDCLEKMAKLHEGSVCYLA